MNSIPKLLSKTKLMRGYRCMKCIYLTIHNPGLEAPITPETQALFDQGNMVGAKAREYFPDGVLVDNKPWDFGGALAKTRELLAAKTPIIYEAAFEYMGCYARADIIQFSPETGKWRIFEVKSSTKVKPEQYDDVGLQAWIMAKSGLPLEQINIMHLNTECRYPDLSNLFTTVDVTQDIRDRYLSVQPKIRDILTAIRHPNTPETYIGSYCSEPTECGFKEYCWKEKNIPEMSIFNLPRIRDKKWDLYSSGIISLTDSRLTDMDELQHRIIDCHRTGERYLNREAIHQAMAAWQFPLVFLDFETINPAIPRYNGTRPFEQVPFQFSVHYWPSPDAPISHDEFLHDEKSDPRPALIPALLKACRKEGSIVAYFGQFESDRIKALAEFSPEHSGELLRLTERIVDPLPIIREAIYDPKFKGSFSLKYVAPALLGEEQSYAGMLVGNGGEAQRAFEEMIADKTTPMRKAELYEALIAYCKKDTEVMVELTKWLYQQ